MEADALWASNLDVCPSCAAELRPQPVQQIEVSRAPTCMKPRRCSCGPYAAVRAACKCIHGFAVIDARGWDRVLPGDAAAPRPLLYPLTQSVWLHRNLLEWFDGLFLIGGISGHDFLLCRNAVFGGGGSAVRRSPFFAVYLQILWWWNHCWIQLGWLASLELLRPCGCGSVAAPWIAAWRYSSLASSCSPCCGKRSRTVG